MEEYAMDVICTCCGEPWDVYHVLHEERDGFNRKGTLITACPCCHGRQPNDLTALAHAIS